jgi:hypothetical protein
LASEQSTAGLKPKQVQSPRGHGDVDRFSRLMGELAALIGSRGSSDFIRASGSSPSQQAGHMTEGRQPFTAEIKTLAKGPSTYEPLENTIRRFESSGLCKTQRMGRIDAPPLPQADSVFGGGLRITPTNCLRRISAQRERPAAISCLLRVC